MGNKAIGTASLAVGLFFIALAFYQMAQGNGGVFFGLFLLGAFGVAAGLRVGSDRSGS